MPAIQLDKLKLQTANLAGKVGQPDLFQADLLDLFDHYSNRTFRAGTNTLANRMSSTYHLPDRVLWQIERDLEPQIHIYDQEQSLILAETLWSGKSLEEKQIAIFILGQIPVEVDQPILETFTRWFQPGLDPHLRMNLVTVGLDRLRQEKFEDWMSLVQQWLASPLEEKHAQAFLALVELLQETGDTHLPSVNKIVSDVVLDTPASLHHELITLFRVMVQVSLIETSYLTRDIIRRSNPQNVNHKRLLRKMIQLFPDAEQPEIKRQYLEHFRAGG